MPKHYMWVFYFFYKLQHICNLLFKFLFHGWLHLSLKFCRQNHWMLSGLPKISAHMWPECQWVGFQWWAHILSLLPRLPSLIGGLQNHPHKLASSWSWGEEERKTEFLQDSRTFCVQKLCDSSFGKLLSSQWVKDLLYDEWTFTKLFKMPVECQLVPGMWVLCACLLSSIIPI